jgi:hypothetical protein
MPNYRPVDANGQPHFTAVAYNIANAAGSGAGATVTVPVSFVSPAFGTGQLPPNYAVNVAPSQAATTHVTAKTSSGFNVVLTPVLASTTLAAGTFDVVVHS